MSSVCFGFVGVSLSLLFVLFLVLFASLLSLSLSDEVVEEEDDDEEVEDEEPGEPDDDVERGESEIG